MTIVTKNTSYAHLFYFSFWDVNFHKSSIQFPTTIKQSISFWWNVVQSSKYISLPISWTSILYFNTLLPQPSLEFKWWPVRKLYMENLKWRNKHIIFEFRISAPIQKTWSFVQSLWNQMGVSPPIRGKWWVSIIWPWRWLCVATPSHQSCKQLELILLITH